VAVALAVAASAAGAAAALLKEVTAELGPCQLNLLLVATEE
jgi:hypothetical protein